MPYKIERLERAIEKEVSVILLNSKDKRLNFVTVTKVHLTGDASIATIFYTILGNEDQIESTKKSLENAKGYVRTSLGKAVEMRKVPELIFKYDESMEYGRHIEDILKGLNL